MKNYQLFFSGAFTFLVVILTTLASISSAQKSNETHEGRATPILVYSTPSGLPIDNSKDHSVPEFKTLASCSSLQSSSYIRFNQEIIFLFNSLFEVTKIEINQHCVPVAVNGLFLILFRTIISPNAP
jgi:hypothetical protein